MEAANRVLRRRLRGAPPWRGLGAPDACEREPGPVAVLECERRFAEPLRGRIVGDALLDEALGPVADRAFRNAEYGLLRLADSEPAGRRALPGEKGEDRARMAGPIAIVKVIGAGIVEIDRLLHQAQAERSGIEIEVAARRTCNGRDMMDAAGHAPLRFGVLLVVVGVTTVERDDFGSRFQSVADCMPLRARGQLWLRQPCDQRLADLRSTQADPMTSSCSHGIAPDKARHHWAADGLSRRSARRLE